MASVCGFMRCGFISEWNSFCFYMIPKWNVIPEQKFHSGMKTGMNSFPNDLTFVSVSCKQIQRNIYGMEWTRSGMRSGKKVIPESCKQALSHYLQDFATVTTTLQSRVIGYFWGLYEHFKGTFTLTTSWSWIILNNAWIPNFTRQARNKLKA